MLISISEIVLECLIQVSVVGAVYIVGFWQWSVAWLIAPVILSVLQKLLHKERQYRRDLAKGAACSLEERVLYARLGRHDYFPSWVSFPDVERVEWLNRIMLQMWPKVNHFASDFLADFRPNNMIFERINLGAVPPRIGGVKVYNKNTSSNEIVMDIDFCYAGDCDITIGLQLIRAGIIDLQIRGMLRVVMKPLITKMPFVGSLEISFLNKPSIDFELVGPGLVGIFGISNLVSCLIADEVANRMVFPKKLVIKLSDDEDLGTLRRKNK